MHNKSVDSIKRFWQTGTELLKKKQEFVLMHKIAIQDMVLFREETVAGLNRVAELLLQAQQDGSSIFALLERIMEFDAIFNVKGVAIMQQIDSFKNLLADPVINGVLMFYYGKEIEELEKERELILKIVNHGMTLREEAFELILHNCHFFPQETLEFISKNLCVERNEIAC